MLKRCFFLVVCASLLLGFISPVKAVDNPHCQSWSEVVRVRIADTATNEVLDFAAANHIASGSQSADLHFTGSNPSGQIYNSPLIALSSRPHDRMWIDANLISGHIDATMQVYNMQTGLWQVIEMRINTHAPPSSSPYVFVGGEYIRNTRGVDGVVRIDGQTRYDLRHAAGLDVQAWNSSTCEPHT